MSNRSYIEKQYTLLKREIRLYCTVSVGAAGAVTLQKWNYPTFGTGPNARTYTAASTGPALLSGAGNWPAQYAVGSEGVYSVTRATTGLWTVKFQDTYQRLTDLHGYISVAGGASNIVTIAENSTVSAVTTASGAVVGVALLSSTATLADPTSGHIVNLTFTFQDATEP